MAIRVAVYQIPGHLRSTHIATAMAAGARKCGEIVRVIGSSDFRSPDADVAVFYGFDASLQRVFASYRSDGLPVVYVDLGYWGRHDGGKRSGYHKISVNNRHPTAYFQKRSHDGSRIRRFNLDLKDWTAGRSILLAGTSARAAAVDGFAPEEWERAAAARLREFTDRPIIYRPKPSWPGAKPIPGTTFEADQAGLPNLLLDCHAVVTHHSNVSVDGLIAGVPAFCLEGVASPLALQDLSEIERPNREGDRVQLLRDISWCQWNVAEMSEGLAWRYLRDEGLI